MQLPVLSILSALEDHCLKWLLECQPPQKHLYKKVRGGQFFSTQKLLPQTTRV